MPLLITLLTTEEIAALEEIFGPLWHPIMQVEPEGEEVLREPADSEARFEYYRKMMERPLA